MTKVTSFQTAKFSYELLKEIREQTKASYHSIITGIKKCGLDKEAVINYLREIAIVYA